MLITHEKIDWLQTDRLRLERETKPVLHSFGNVRVDVDYCKLSGPYNDQL